jgi:hypothetical protein
MRSQFLTYVFAVLLLLVGNQAVRSQPRPNEALTNQSVVKLAKAGFKEKTIISIIYARIPNFDLSADRLIQLKQSGVSEKIIMAMLARQEGATSFDDGELGLPSTSSTPNSDPGTDIFGSSGGQKSRSKSNGSNGAATGESITSGSATVRIIRPPSETDSEAVKLEKTKSLTNDSIIELVEAGFSEGTIIRRIEQSPVDFDLAEPKIAELRKRRVSDKILSAMKTAMGDESSK